MIEKGYTESMKIDTKQSPRKETDEKTQRPAKHAMKSVKGDGGRGSFKDKC